MQHLKALVFDWAGTTVDFGCQGPVQAFVESFADFNVDISPAEARGPMGMGKREHVAALFALPRIAEVWKEQHGSPYSENSIDEVYARVEASMLSCITRYCTPITGTLEAIAAMQQKGLRIGSCTGYPRSVGLALAAEAKKHGYAPELMVCATDVPQGRPAPDMCQAVLSTFNVAPHQAVKVGDTVNDVLEGVNAGMWVIGLTLCGSLAGLSQQEVDALAPAERDALESRIAKTLCDAGAHYTAPHVLACLPILEEIDKRAQAGERP